MSELKIDGEKNPDRWQCPRCRWLVDECCYLAIKFDAPCPRCGTLYSSFNRIKAERERDERQKREIQ